jgi:hypothetical protein
MDDRDGPPKVLDRDICRMRDVGIREDNYVPECQYPDAVGS